MATAAAVFLALTTVTGMASASAAGTRSHFVAQARGVVQARGVAQERGHGLRTGQAATAHHLCLTNAPSLCMEANGAGNQVTITASSNDYMNLYIVVSTTCHFGMPGYPCYSYQDGNGNCLRGGTNNVVKMENGPCPLDDSADLWVWTGTNYVKNFQYEDTMLTHRDVAGDNVWHATPVSGDWVHWTLT